MNAKTLLVRNDQTIERVGYMTNSEAAELSKLADIAAVVCLAVTMNGNHLIYSGGTVAEYDPVESEFIGSGAVFDRHLGYVS